MTPADTAHIKTKDDLIAFLDQVREDFSRNGHTWENQDISRFLEAFQSWLDSSENYYNNAHIPLDTVTPWKHVADAFAAARIYE
jgi:hypothetical protein